MAVPQTQFPASINVVPSGYRWTREAAEKAALKSAFLRVGGTSVTRRYLSGAERSWAKPAEAGTIFNIAYRITGSVEAVKAALSYANFNDDQIADAVADSINSTNYDGKRAQEYQRELAAHALQRKDKPQTEGYEWGQVLWFGQNVKSAKIGTKTGEGRGAVVGGKRASPGESMASKIQKLADGRSLDVSAMDMVTGKNVKNIAAPTRSSSGRFGSTRSRIVSSDLPRYIRAIELAYGAEGLVRFKDDIEAARKAIAHNNGVEQPGANLAPAVKFFPRAATPRAFPRPASPAGLATQGGERFAPIPPFLNQ